MGNGGGARGGGMSAQVVLGESDGKGGVGGEVQFGVAFAPVPCLYLALGGRVRGAVVGAVT